MGTTSRFTNGVTNVTRENVLGQLKTLDPTTNHEYFNDFDTYVAGNWNITSVGAATRALTDEDGGILLITNAAADNDSSFLQKKGESFLIEVGKKAFFKARLKVSDATQSEFIIGLQITDTAPLDVSDGIFFQKDDGDANLDFHVEKDNTASTDTAIATIVDNTYITIAFFYNGINEVRYYAGTDDRNPVALGSLPVTNLPDDEELTISFGIQNGEASAKTMSVDYIFAAKER